MNDFAGYARAPEAKAPLTDFDWMVRTQVYASFGRSGRSLSADDIAALTGASLSRVSASLMKLHDARELVVTKAGEVGMAHPFSATTTAFPVETREFTCYANCVWDALAIPALLKRDGWTATTCPASGEPLEFGVKRWNVEGDDDIVVHLMTPLRHAWDDIGFT
ncbi:MAG: organomercurial lyase [Longimicrobiales bacterium]|nr:organomercurial lyase [Longimicrobiales bacterium]